MKLNIKRLHIDSIIPTKANKGDAGWDLYSHEFVYYKIGHRIVINTGIAVEIPFNHVGLILDRSSMGTRGFKVMGGVIDSSYRGEIKVILQHIPNTRSWGNTVVDFNIRPKEKIAQLVIIPIAPIDAMFVVEELSNTERGEKGFGSSDIQEEEATYSRCFTDTNVGDD